MANNHRYWGSFDFCSINRPCVCKYACRAKNTFMLRLQRLCFCCHIERFNVEKFTQPIPHLWFIAGQQLLVFTQGITDIGYELINRNFCVNPHPIQGSYGIYDLFGIFRRNARNNRKIQRSPLNGCKKVRKHRIIGKNALDQRQAQAITLRDL